MSELAAAGALDRRRVLRSRVAALAHELEHVDLQAAQLRIEFQAAVREAAGAGIPQTVLAKEAGLSRQRIGQLCA